ncbi:hypothetical protein DMUE_1354 [Dictyocoela muelleri]|nr:hypothetical protein DMUE_1354 [Dictyocoela muelleri]
MLNIVHWIKKAFDEISVEIIFNCWSKTNVFIREEKNDVSTEIIEEDESSSNNSTDSIKNVICFEQKNIKISSSQYVLKSLRTTINFLQAYDSKFVKGGLDLLDKLTDEYLEKHLKEKIEFFLEKNNKKN